MELFSNMNIWIIALVLVSFFRMYMANRQEDERKKRSYKGLAYLYLLIAAVMAIVEYT